jgi:hypothetical protein
MLQSNLDIAYKYSHINSERHNGGRYLTKKLEFHLPAEHSSWLNMAEFDIIIASRKTFRLDRIWRAKWKTLIQT